MRKVVVLEGPDGGGKTTLANYLRDTHDYDIVKTGPPSTDDATTEYLDVLYTAIHGQPTVLDRCHLGEAIYGPLLRGADRMGADGLSVIERVIARHGVRLIICAPPWQTLVEGWRSKEDLVKDEATLRTIYDKYLAHAARLSIVPYDWTAADAELALMKLLEA